MAAINSPLKAALTLFAPSFNRLPLVPHHTARIKASVKGKYDTYSLDMAARLLILSRLINEQAAQLQEQSTLNIISHFDRSYSSFKFDHKTASFQLSKTPQGSGALRELKFTVKSNAIEKFDHPFTRQTLYFHELKDLEKYVEIEERKGIPKFWKDMELSSMENELLDPKNPLGIPHWAKPLLVNVEAHTHEAVCGFDIALKLGEIKLVKCYNRKPDYTHSINPRSLQQKIQTMVFLLLKGRAGLSIEELQKMSMLSFIGGRAKKLQFMLDFLQEMQLKSPTH